MLAMLLFAAGPVLAADPPKFAMIEWVTGPVEILNARGQARPARVSEAIISGETVQTGSGGEMHVRTEDTGVIAFRPNSQVRIDSYLAKGGKDDNLALTLLRGALRSVTGWVGRTNPSGYSVRTPTATVGIRGTDHETHYVPPHAGTDPNLPPAGTYDKVISGSTVLQNGAGQTVIGANQSAHAPNDAKSAPRLLDRTPSIYRPGNNEGRLEMRKAELAREIETRLQDRIKEQREAKEAKDLKDSKEDKDAKDAKDGKDTKDSKDARDPKDLKDKAADKKRRRPTDK
jgi:hypothetical protein